MNIHTNTATTNSLRTKGFQRTITGALLATVITATAIGLAAPGCADSGDANANCGGDDR